jgi:hypothetical protein
MRLLFCEMEEFYLKSLAKSLAFVKPCSLPQTGFKVRGEPEEGMFTRRENEFKQFVEPTALRAWKRLRDDVGQACVPRDLYSRFEFLASQAAAEFWGFSGPPFGSVLIH